MMDELVCSTLAELTQESQVTVALVRGIVFGLRLTECQSKRELNGLVHSARELAAECTAASQDTDAMKSHLRKARRVLYRMLKLLDAIRPVAPNCFGLVDMERHLSELHNLLEWLS